jgi:hypothetical protein
MTSLAAVSANSFQESLLEHAPCFDWAFLSVCINNIVSAAFKNVDPFVHTSLCQTVLSKLGNQLSLNLCRFHSFRHQTHYCMLLILGANI